MSTRGIDEESIKRIVARRARELGSRVSHREVTLEFVATEVAPGCRVFQAWWGVGEAERSLSGLIRDGEAPDTYPAQALGKVFHRWLDAEGKLPDPSHVATVSALLYGEPGLYQVILTEEGRAALVEQPDWLAYIHLPREIEVDGQPGVAFWWDGPYGISRMRVYLEPDGRIQTEEKSIRDILEEERGLRNE